VACDVLEKKFGRWVITLGSCPEAGQILPCFLRNCIPASIPFLLYVGAFQLGGNTLPDRVLAVARPGFAERAGGTPSQNARAPQGCFAKDAGFEQTRRQPEMRLLDV